MNNDYNGKKRSELPDSVFGIPQERKYPMPDEKHTRSAIKLFNHVDPKYEEQLAKAVIKNMKKYGIDGSAVGPNNRLRKYLPEDMIKESMDSLLYEYMYTDNDLDIIIQESGYALTWRIMPILLKAVLSGVDQYDYKYLREKKLPAILKKCKTMDDIKYIRRDAITAKTQLEILKRNVHAVNTNDEQIMKRLNKSFIKKVKDGKITEKEIDTHIRWLGTEYKKLIDARAKEIKDSIKESSIEEGFLKSDKDIYYNKDKFDSGEINLCFITGLSGSGKSTMGRGMSSKDVEHYEMDDIICNYAFSDDNLKEYGGLAESFFKGPGKDYRLKRGDEDHNNAVFDSHENYEKEITQLFVKHAISYCKSHKGIKYVCDGIWIFMFIKPEQLKDCAVYIKGTSSIKSGYRALKRDIDEDKRNGMTSLQIFKHEFKRVKEDILYARENQKELKSFRSYFEKQSTNESVSSTVSKDHKQKGYISLSSLKKVHITESVINKYKKEYPVLRHVRCKDTNEYICDGYMWFKENDLVCYVGSCQYTDDHTKWIVSLEIIPKYRGYGLSNQILDYCVKSMKCKYLSVNKNNELAKKIYDKYGFRVYHEDNTMYYMTIDKNIKESYIGESSNNKVYHLSQTNLDGKTIRPTVPSNYMTKNGYEDGKTKRVCFATSIDGCLRGLSLKCEGMKLFVHVPDGNYNIYKPSNKEVPDASITGEVWIKKAVKMKCIGQIYVIGDKGEDGIPYKYGDKTAELYDWEWKWIDKFNESSPILPQDTGITTVIFDIGDVLVSANIKDYLIADPEIPNEIVDELLKLWFIDKDEVDDTMDLDTYREIVNKRMGVEFSKYIPKLFKYNVDCVAAFDYTIPMIQDLKDKGYKVYYLSNWSAWTHDLLQEAGKFDFLKLMDGGVFSYDVGYMKPDEEIYKILLNKYKINPEEAIFFDDREENIEAANKLGIHGIHFPRHDASIVYDELAKLNKQSISEKFLIPTKINEYKIAKEIESSIKSIVMTSANKSSASKLGLTLKCKLEDVDSRIACILILDGSQDKRDTDEARTILKDIANKCKSKLGDLVSKVDIGDGDEGCLYFTMNRKYIIKNRKDLVQEYGTTGGTIVGANQPDSVYIVNYMQNNVFSGYKEPKQAICKKGMNQMYTTKNGKAVPVDKDKFKEEASDISVFRFKETPILSFDKIIENASVDGDFYMLLTGDYPTNQHEIEYDNRFVQEENFLNELDDITCCTESTITGQIEATDYPYMKVLTESMEGRCWNYYRDINGVFAMNELTGLRTPSYEDITDIPNSQIQLIERGTVYVGE